MSQKSIEEQFARELDDYILGGCKERLKTDRQEASSDEYDELLDIGKELWNQEINMEINEDKLRQTFMEQLEREKENGTMKKGKSMKAVIVAASMAAVLGVGMTQTVLGKEFINSIIAKFTTGHATVLQLDEEKEKSEFESQPIPEEYKGKIFDADGKELTYIPMYLEGAYNAKGEPICCIQDGEVYTEEEWEKKSAEESENEDYTEITDLSKISDYTCFEVKMPTYLPTDVTFKTAGVWSKEDVKDNKYIEMTFVNEKGKEVIYMQQRLACEEAGFETGTNDEVKEVDINGVKGLMYDNSLDWETPDTIYMLMSLDDSITKDEMIKIAQSIK